MVSGQQRNSTIVMQEKILTDLPPELLRTVVKEFSLKELLQLRRVSRCFDCFLLREIKPKSCELVTLTMQQLRNNVHCMALLGDRKAGLHFGALDAREMNVRASVIHDNRRELLFSLSCDNATHRDCALFESAYIHHFRVQKGFPIYPSLENLDWMKQLFRGCTIDKVSLVVDTQSSHHIELIPAFLAQVRARRVEFIVQNQNFPITSTFRDSNFIDLLAATDVRDVAFSADPRGGSCVVADDGSSEHTGADFALLEKLLRAGIMNITMESYGYERNGFQRFKLFPFLRTLSLAAYHVDIVIKSILPVQSAMNVFRMGKKCPRYRVTTLKAGRIGPRDVLRITTLKDDEEPTAITIAL